MTSESRITAFARDELRLDLTEAQAALLADFELGGYSEAVIQAGRRGGKSLLADVICLYDAVARDEVLRSRMRPSEEKVSAIISPRLDQSLSHIRNCRTLIDGSVSLAAMLTSETSETLTFMNGSTIRAFPASARGIRGGAWSCTVLDEMGHFVTSEDGNAAGDRILEAVRPSAAQFAGDGWLWAISTPLWKQGGYWKLVERASSGRFGHMFYRHLSTAQMNPRISAAWLEQQRQADPEMYGREYEARFLDGASSFLSSADVQHCVRPRSDTDDAILPPAEGISYSAAIDPAFAQDRFALGIAHMDQRTELLVIDGVWTWSRVGFERTLDEVSEMAARYRITTLRTDQFSSQAIVEGLARRHLSCDVRTWSNDNKYQSYTRLKAMVNTRTVQLPDDPDVVAELIGLEARPTSSGATRIAAAGSGHDDRASVIAALTDSLAGTSDQVLAFFASDPEEFDPVPGRRDRMAAQGWVRWDGHSPIPMSGVIDLHCAECGADARAPSTRTEVLGHWGECDPDVYWRPVPEPAAKA